MSKLIIPEVIEGMTLEKQLAILNHNMQILEDERTS